MPVHQGIKLTVVSQLELRIHPEFPHPESSQFTYRSPTLTGEEITSGLLPPSLSSDSKADKILGRPSTVSVYIPSQPGARFWLRYDVTKATEPKAPWYYFKLFMNGRHIASWGTNSELRPAGQVMRALYDPTSRWNYKHDDTIYKNCGTEIRPFYFSNKQERSAADDGGLMEVRVFRSSSRRRKEPNPAEFKPQDQYGLVLPSTGLVEDPLDAKYYDWILIDPIDRPLATFKFHYRSWDNLSALQLIPKNHGRTLLRPTPSILSLNGQSAEALSKKEAAKRAKAEEQGEHVESSSNASLGTFGRRSGFAYKPDSFEHDNASSTSVHGDESDAFESADRKGALNVPRSPSPYYRSLSPTPPQSQGLSLPAVPRPSHDSQRDWAQIQSRPLPEIPRGSGGGSTPYSRRSSVASRTQSLAASVKEHIDRGILSPSPTVETASAVKFNKPQHPSRSIELRRNRGREKRPVGSEVVPTPNELPSKRMSGGLLANVTLRKHRKSSSPKSSSRPRASSSGYTRLEDEPQRGEFRSRIDNTALSLTESEWLWNAPSAKKYVSKYRTSGRTQATVREEEDDDDSEERALLRKQAMDWYDSAAESVTEPGEADSFEDLGDIRVPGSWI